MAWPSVSMLALVVTFHFSLGSLLICYACFYCCCCCCYVYQLFLILDLSFNKGMCGLIWIPCLWFVTKGLVKTQFGLWDLILIVLSTMNHSRDGLIRLFC